MIPIGLAENSNNYLITRVRQGQILKSVFRAEANSTTIFSCFGKSCKFKLKCIHVCVWRGVGGGKHLNLWMRLGGKRGEGMGGGSVLSACVMCVCVLNVCLCIACITVKSSVLLLNVEDRTLVKSSLFIIIIIILI